MSRTLIFVVVPVVVAIVGYGAFILLGAWIDGRRQAVREKGLHPVTEPDGSVEAREYVDKDKTMSFRRARLQPCRRTGKIDAAIAAEEIAAWRQHERASYEDIWIDLESMHGAPCLKGTRVTPETILVNYDGAVEDGLDGEEAALLVHSYFPTVTVEQIRRLIAYVDTHEVEAHE